MNENDRLMVLSKLIKEEKIGNQADLQSRLVEKGFETTQSSISRDLKRLGVIKVKGIYRSPRIAPGDSSRIDRLDGRLAGENMLVLRTGPGSANRAAFEIDEADLPEVLGTIAGDDTIFIAVESAAKGNAALKKIFALFK